MKAGQNVFQRYQAARATWLATARVVSPLELQTVPHERRESARNGDRQRRPGWHATKTIYGRR